MAWMVAPLPRARVTGWVEGGGARGYTRASGAIAQMGERLLCKQEVAGSIPAGSIGKYLQASSFWVDRGDVAVEMFPRRVPQIPVHVLARGTIARA